MNFSMFTFDTSRVRTSSNIFLKSSSDISYMNFHIIFLDESRENLFLMKWSIFVISVGSRVSK